MPRKVKKTGKPPLQFLEPPSSVAKLHNVPEVRASLNPKSFFRENKAESSSALNSWVSPQFNTSALSTLPAPRRGRRRCQSAVSILDGCTQLSRKSSVCKFPPLSFQGRSRDQTKSSCARTAIQRAVVPGVRSKPQGVCADKKSVSSSVKHCDPSKRQAASIRRKITETFSDASLSRCSDQPNVTTLQATKSCSIPADGASTPPCNDFPTADVSGVMEPPPDVDTPKGSGCQSPPSIHSLLNPAPCEEPADILVADTPERDYGVKVTWRRRKHLMLLLKEKGHLSESDALIH